jgi:SAM-dependent methyltransferase
MQLLLLFGGGKRRWSCRGNLGMTEAILPALLPLLLSLRLTNSFSPNHPNYRALHQSTNTPVSKFALSGDEAARSAFGTKEYWDELYAGRGDFPADEYTWYFGFDSYQQIVQEHVNKDSDILIPGIGNDPILLNLLQKGYQNLTATDYSEHAIDRQLDLISYQYSEDAAELRHMDARQMDETWTDRFDVIMEKGALDAIYLSGEGNLELSVEEFQRILKPGGVLISVSGVVPEELRREVFKEWEWIRDGSDELKAGCFVLRWNA